MRYVIALLLSITFSFVRSQVPDARVRNFYAVEKAEQRKFVIREMNLNEWEKDAFWNVYDSYNRSIEYLELEYIVFLERIATGSKDRSLSEHLLQTEWAIARKRLEYYRRFCRAIPVEEVNRFMKLDEAMRAVLKQRLYDTNATDSVPVLVQPATAF